MSFIEDCKEVISLESTANSGNELFVQFLKERAEKLGYVVELQQSPRNHHLANILIRPIPYNGQEELLLHSSLETVEPGSHFLWDKTSGNPFHLSIHGDELFGLGVTTKLDLLCKIEACKEFVNKKTQLPFVIAGTYGSYSGMSGAIQLVRRKKINAYKALISAPTLGQLCNAGLGYAIFEIIFPFSEGEIQYQQKHDLMENASTQSKMFYSESKESNAIDRIFEYAALLPSGVVLMDVDGGMSEHSAPETAILEMDMVGSVKDTALEKMSKAYKKLMTMKQGFENYSQEGFSLEGSQISLNQLRKFSDHVVLTGCCKLLPSMPEGIYEKWIEDTKKACEDLGLKFRVKEYKQAFEVPEHSHFLNACRQSLTEAHLNDELGKLSVYTEASVFSKLGVECLVYGPAAPEVHLNSTNESVKMSDLEKSIQFYTHVIKKVCL